MENQNKRNLAFRCYAYPATIGERHGYYAICVDLNLFTWRPTRDQAKESLDDAICGYLETVAELAKDENLTDEQFAKRIYRQAPFFPHRARYYLYRLLAKMIKELHRAHHEDRAYKSRVDISGCAVA